MRKIFVASAVGLAMVAGQAAAANGTAQSLAVGDRVGAALGPGEGLQPTSGFNGWLRGQSFLNVFFGIVIPTLIFTKIVVDDVNQDDLEDSPS